MRGASRLPEHKMAPLASNTTLQTPLPLSPVTEATPGLLRTGKPLRDPAGRAHDCRACGGPPRAPASRQRGSPHRGERPRTPAATQKLFQKSADCASWFSKPAPDAWMPHDVSPSPHECSWYSPRLRRFSLLSHVRNQLR